MRTPKDGGGKAVAALLLALLLVSAAAAQMQVGDDVSMTLTGNVGVGYGGSSSSTGLSSNSVAVNGTSNLNGWYYHPNFLSFSVQPYYNRSQSNASTESTLSSTGLITSASLFTGSRFPGSVSYSRQYSGSSEFGLPGQAGLSASGQARAFSVTWSAFLEDLPTLTASFSTNSSSSNILGTTGDSKSATKTFSLNSTYQLAGFNLQGFLNHQTTAMTFPDFLGLDNVGSGSGTTYGISATHRLPMSGSFGANWSRSSFGNEGSSNSHGASNNLSVAAGISPIRKLTLSGDLRYITNLRVALQQSIFAGSGVLLAPIESGSSSVALHSMATYAVGRGLVVRGYVTHREQFYSGKDVSDTLYGGTVTFNYYRPLFGLLNFSFGMVDTANQNGNSSLGFHGSVSMNRKFGRWDTAADFSYAQNVQTLISLYSTSSISYGGSVRRKVTQDIFWSGSVRTSQSALTRLEGEGSRSHSGTTSLTWRRYTVTAAYAMSRGTTILGPSGVLTPVPEAGLITDDTLLYNGRSFTVGLSASPLKKMTLTGHWVKAKSDTTTSEKFSLNQTERFNSRMEYRLRQLSLVAGFTRDRQGISASGAPPSVVNSYYFGISRWFNVF